MTYPDGLPPRPCGTTGAKGRKNRLRFAAAIFRPDFSAYRRLIVIRPLKKLLPVNRTFPIWKSLVRSALFHFRARRAGAFVPVPARAGGLVRQGPKNR